VNVVSLVDPKQTINMSLGQEKVVVIHDSGTVTIMRPTTIDLYRTKFRTRKEW